jgi:membrane-bound lytic murein transglycosylase MltF
MRRLVGRRPHASVMTLLLGMGAAISACKQSPSSSGTAPSAPDAGVAAAEPAGVVPLEDLQTAELLQLNVPLKGDFDQMQSRRFVRALVPYSRTFYFLDGPHQRGLAYESLAAFEKSLAKRAPRGVAPTKIVIIPTSRERLLPALAEGYGDVAVGGFTITEARRTHVDFSDPTADGIRSVVVTGPDVPPLTRLEDLSGREVSVRRTSSYYEDLAHLNERLVRDGHKPDVIRPADEMLEDEDLIEMTDAGIVPITIARDITAKLWAQLYDRITVHTDLALRTDGQTAWALRKDTPVFRSVVNDFVKGHRAGTLFGNMMIRKYFGDAGRLKNPTTERELQKFRKFAAAMKKYGKQYDLDWLLVIAQGYQESQLDQARRSPAGAIGVMQIKPSTAADKNVGIPDVTTADNNIHAGVKYMRFMLNRYYKDAPMDSLNKGLFALASYNAGPARVAGLRSKAQSMGLNPNVWFREVEIVAAKDIGRETVDYVSNIYKYYTAYKAVAERRAARARARSMTGASPPHRSNIRVGRP